MIKQQNRFYWFLSLLFILCLQGQAQNRSLSSQAKISLLTVSPSDDEVYTVYGHSALRIQDTINKLDHVFNYGLFSFSKPNFIYRFAKGETDYQLGVAPFRDFLLEYELRGSEVTEQVLALDSAEKARIWKALLINYQPENREYRYNFFYDNCATRPAEIIEKQIQGQINFPPQKKAQSFRDLINYCTRNHPWLTFGCDLALGSPTDQPITAREELFLPVYLKEAFRNATVTYTNGAPKQLVESEQILTEGTMDESDIEHNFFTPLICCWSFFLLIAAITYLEWRKRSYFQIVDCLLFLLAGLAGCVLFFLCFISTHPCIWPNWSILWLHPFDLIAVILFAVKRLRKAADWYHFINFAALTLLLIGWHFIPQHFNSAFIPLVMSLWLRSGYSVYRKIWNIEYGKF